MTQRTPFIRGGAVIAAGLALTLAACGGSPKPAGDDAASAEAAAIAAERAELDKRAAELAEREAALATEQADAAAAAKAEADKAAAEAAAAKEAADKLAAEKAEAARLAAAKREAEFKSAQSRPASQPAPKPAPKPIVVASGTALPIAFTSGISTKTAKVGDPVSARLTSALVVDGRQVAPAGAAVTGVVSEVYSGSREIGGTPRLGIRFERLSLGGQAVQGHRVPQRQVRAGHRGDAQGQVVGVFFYPADFTFVCPTELGDLADHYADLPEAGRGDLRRLDRHALHAQGLARHLGHDQEDPVPDDRRPDRHDHPQLRRDDRGGGPGAARHLRRRPEGRSRSCEITTGGIGRDAKELLRKVQAAQYVAAHPGEVCPAKWKPGEKTLARRWTWSARSDRQDGPPRRQYRCPIAAAPRRAPDPTAAFDRRRSRHSWEPTCSTPLKTQLKAYLERAEPVQIVASLDDGEKSRDRELLSRSVALSRLSPSSAAPRRAAPVVRARPARASRARPLRGACRSATSSRRSCSRCCRSAATRRRSSRRCSSRPRARGRASASRPTSRCPARTAPTSCRR
jgi:NADH-dependent peroxiredoxin subunit C